MGGNIALKYQHENMRTDKKQLYDPQWCSFFEGERYYFPIDNSTI